MAMGAEEINENDAGVTIMTGRHYSVQGQPTGCGKRNRLHETPVS
jgi:hypothetical protein